ncbi:RrF2 family transcriptional regulator [Demequina litorisediminis]|uniref:RrF2 family transcriptional regulator n=1 Tax=Demequina litorisediminis TaxID=1849022 RepID=UPI0032AFD914
MRISAKADYAVRAAAELAASEPGATRTAEELATAQNIPRKFLEAILTALRSAGLVVSQRGLGGGYRLAHDAAEVSVADVVRAVDGPLVFVRGERPSEPRLPGRGGGPPARVGRAARQRPQRPGVSHVGRSGGGNASGRGARDALRRRRVGEPGFPIFLVGIVSY